MHINTLKKLRNRQPVKFFEKKTGLIHHFQINKREAFICWERWVRYPNSPAINWNMYLSLKDIDRCIKTLNQ